MIERLPVRAFHFGFLIQEPNDDHDPSRYPVSPLRQRLIDDMTMRHFLIATQRNYIRDVGHFATFLRRLLDTMTVEDVRQFQRKR